jgi:aminoglycoside phosphotransferase (APT) family kinase protein
MSLTGAERLRYESQVLTALDRAPNLSELRPLFPTRRAEGATGRWWYVLDSHLSGTDATTAVDSGPGLRRVVETSAVRVASALHRATATPVTVDEVLLQRWVDEPVDDLVHLLRNLPGPWSSERLARLQVRLHEDLTGRRVHAGWIHGDFWLGNLRVDPVTGAATGVVDWDCAGPRELPAHDLLHLALYSLAVQRGSPLGAVVAESLAEGTWPTACEEVIGHARWSWDETISDSTVLLLYWLRHVMLVARQQRDHVQHSVLAWRWQNVVRVLRCL